jgi:NADH-quinone oxidoreductase subunit N
MEAIVVIFLTGLLAMFIGILNRPNLVILVALIGLALTLVVQNLPIHFLPEKYQLLSFGNYANSFASLAVVFTGAILLGGLHFLKEEKTHTGDYSALLLFSLSGAFCLIGAEDFFMFFLGVEILSIPLYVLAGSRKKSEISSEAAIKYFFTGALATCLLLFGIALVYGGTGSFEIDKIATSVNAPGTNMSFVFVGMLFIMAALLFKVGAFPFHFWVPDVYQGSPSVFMAYMASVVKLVGVFAFMKLFQSVFVDLHYFWSGIIAVVIFISMFIGNLSALNQTQFKRLMAFSSITNGAYALMAILNRDIASEVNLWVFMLGYGSSVIAMLTISMTMKQDENAEVSSFRGIGYKNPFIGVVAILALLSMSGIPPLTGFFGKTMLFASAFNDYLLLVIFALVNSAIGVYFYLKFIMLIMSKDQTSEVEVKIDMNHYLVLGFCALAITFGWGMIFFI